MVFNHYAKIKTILDAQDAEWHIRLVREPTTAKNFKGEARLFDHYYRIYDSDNKPIPYCKFQQLDRFAQTMRLNAEDLLIHEEQS